MVAETDAIPLLDDLNPEHCYTYWDLLLNTRRKTNAVKDGFLYGGYAMVMAKVWHFVPYVRGILYDGGRIGGASFIRARWDLLPPDRYMWASVQTVRGCPKHCSFCSVWRTDGQAPRHIFDIRI